MKNHKSRKILIYLTAFLLVFFYSRSENKSDSLKIEIVNHQTDDSTKVNLFFQLGNQYEYFKSKERIEYYIAALNLAKKIDFKDGIHRISVQLITNLSHRQLYDVALEYCNNYIQYLIESKQENYFKKVYKVYATLLSKQGKYKESLEYNFKALNYYLEEKNEVSVATVLSNICLLHLSNNQPDSAYFYGLRAIDLFRKNNRQSEMANSILSIAEIKLAKADYANAKLKALEALNVYSGINLKLGLMQTYFVIGQIDLKQGLNDSAIVNFERTLEITNEYYNAEMKRDCYAFLAKIYQVKGDYKKAYENQTNFSSYNDSVSDQKLKAKTLEMDARYSISKKEGEIKDKEHLIEVQNKQRNFLILGIIGVIALLIASYRSYLQKKKATEIITEQKKLVDEKQKEILDSIQYAKRIQNTLLAHTDFINKHIPDNFILFKPKDIVSGDFYWATFLRNKTVNPETGYVYGKFYLAVCDSTGHGVPGAFMSLLNINFLNEAINEKGIERPDEVFNFVRKRLIDNISKEGQKDGFDGILLCIETLPSLMSEGPKTIVTYAAANNAPILIRKKTETKAVEAPELRELESDRMPVGIGERKESFTLHNLELSKGDTLYLYTDGFADQFGGPKGKKFKYKQLNELLLNINSLTLVNQKQNLENVFTEWKGNLEQVDDVCLIGLKIR